MQHESGTALIWRDTGFNNVSAFLGQENNKLHFFRHLLIVFNELASSRTSVKAFFL